MPQDNIVKIDALTDTESVSKPIQEHFHETDQIDFRYLKNLRLYVHHSLVGDSAVTAQNWNVFWIVPFNCTLVEVKEAHQSAFSSGTLQLEKLTGTQNLDGGVTLLSSTLDLTGTANTVNTPTLTSTFVDKQFASGNRIALKDGGTLVGGSNVSVTLKIKPMI